MGAHELKRLESAKLAKKTFLFPHCTPSASGTIRLIMSSSYQLLWLQNSQKYLPNSIFSGALFIWVWTEGLSESETDMRKRTVTSRLLYPHFPEVPRTWEPERHFLCRVSVLAICSLLEVVWHITVLQLLSHGDTRFTISIVWLLNPSMAIVSLTAWSW